MKGFLKYVLIVPALLSCVALAAQVSFTVSVDKNPVTVNDTLELTFTLENFGGHFKPKDLKGFELIDGSETSLFKREDGQISRKFSYIYTLFPRTVGTFVIGEASVETDKDTLITEPITINVVSDDSNHPKTTTQDDSQIHIARISSNDDLIAEIKLDKTKVFQGEQVIVKYYMYNRFINLDSLEYNFPFTSGFYSHNFKDEPSGWFKEREVINGKKYRVAVIKRQILFPQNEGELIIDPFTIDGHVQNSIVYSGRKIQAKSNSSIVEVLKLPEEPEGFNGEIGNYTFEVVANKNTIRINDTLKVRVIIAGQGNLNTVKDPPVNLPSKLVIYDAKGIDNFKVSKDGLSGSREFEYLIIPRTIGTYIIEPISFVFFDPKTATYKTLNSEPIEFTVN